MLRRIDRVVLRVPQLASAVAYYRDVLGMKLLGQQPGMASFALADGGELVLHDNPDLPYEEVYYLVQSVRELYENREKLRLKFAGPPQQAARGLRARVKDPFGNILLLLDRSTESAAGQSVEAGAAAGGMLFAGVPQRTHTKREALIAAYVKIGRTADDLPYTPHFESLYDLYAAGFGEEKPTREEVWRQLLNLRKGGKLPRLGEARSRPPEMDEPTRLRLRQLLGEDIGRRDRLPYSERFENLVNAFNAGVPRPLSPHAIWRMVATLAK